MHVSQGQCLLTDAPSSAGRLQLEELHIAVTRAGTDSSAS